jgi:phosphoribosylaminoimidazolecarboxamide formyltransferase/IMP cyclohydrolase
MTTNHAASPIALLSVSDKRGLIAFAQRLESLGYQLVSTGGTFKELRNAGLPVTYVSELTGFPEILDGRVKTLHPAVHAGILHRRDLPHHAEQLRAQGLRPVDVVAVNLYPFAQAVADADIAEPDAIEQIDIGGPAMVRAAAKNFAAVTVVVSPDDYDGVASALESGSADIDLRRALARRAFEHTAQYDATIAAWFARNDPADLPLPASTVLPLRRELDLRYGENPHQAAALYRVGLSRPLGGARLLQGKELSYNNLLDADAAAEALREFEEPTAVVVKHTNPCGVGTADTIEGAWELALAADPVSAFGGIVATNRPVSAALARKLSDLFLEVVVAPGFEPEACGILAAKKALRLLQVAPGSDNRPRYRSTAFGLLAQTPDPSVELDFAEWRVVTHRHPTDAESRALRFLWRVCKHVKSNAIVVGDHRATAGVGAGQMSRVDAVNLALKRANICDTPFSLASDAFFPFRDGVDLAAKGGVRAIIQPGGSRRDDEVIVAANEHNIAMVFVGRRHFRH